MPQPKYMQTAHWLTKVPKDETGMVSYTPGGIMNLTPEGVNKYQATFEVAQQYQDQYRHKYRDFKPRFSRGSSDEFYIREYIADEEHAIPGRWSFVNPRKNQTIDVRPSDNGGVVIEYVKDGVVLATDTSVTSMEEYATILPNLVSASRDWDFSIKNGSFSLTKDGQTVDSATKNSSVIDISSFQQSNLFSSPNLIEADSKHETEHIDKVTFKGYSEELLKGAYDKQGHPVEYQIENDAHNQRIFILRNGNGFDVQFIIPPKEKGDKEEILASGFITSEEELKSTLPRLVTACRDTQWDLTPKNPSSFKTENVFVFKKGEESFSPDLTQTNVQTHPELPVISTKFLARIEHPELSSFSLDDHSAKWGAPHMENGQRIEFSNLFLNDTYLKKSSGRSEFFYEIGSCDLDQKIRLDWDKTSNTYHISFLKDGHIIAKGEDVTEKQLPLLMPSLIQVAHTKKFPIKDGRLDFKARPNKEEIKSNEAVDQSSIGSSKVASSSNKKMKDGYTSENSDSISERPSKPSNSPPPNPYQLNIASHFPQYSSVSEPLTENTKTTPTKIHEGVNVMPDGSLKIHVPKWALTPLPKTEEEQKKIDAIEPMTVTVRKEDLAKPIPGHKGWTPLHYASFFNQEGEAAYLIEHGADPTAKTSAEYGACLTPAEVIVYNQKLETYFKSQSPREGTRGYRLNFRSANRRIPLGKKLDNLNNLVDRLDIQQGPVNDYNFKTENSATTSNISITGGSMMKDELGRTRFDSDTQGAKIQFPGGMVYYVEKVEGDRFKVYDAFGRTNNKTYSPTRIAEAIKKKTKALDRAAKSTEMVSTPQLPDRFPSMDGKIGASLHQAKVTTL